MKYFDAHCHIQFDPYDADREAIIASMREGEVGGLVVGTDRDSSRKAVELANGTDLFASVGLHPNDKPNEGYDDTIYRELASSPHVVAIGECGLDYYRPEDPGGEKERQVAAFKAQIKLAADLDKPLMIHARPSKGSMDAYEDTAELLRQAQEQYGSRVRGNMHFYVGNVEITKKLLELGCTFSFTAVLTFTSDYDDVIRFLPLESILSETDAPYVAPAPNRGKRNDPLSVREVVRAIARIKGLPEEQVREAMVQNAARVFGLQIAGA